MRRLGMVLLLAALAAGGAAGVEKDVLAAAKAAIEKAPSVETAGDLAEALGAKAALGYFSAVAGRGAAPPALRGAAFFGLGKAYEKDRRWEEAERAFGESEKYFRRAADSGEGRTALEKDAVFAMFSRALNLWFDGRLMEARTVMETVLEEWRRLGEEASAARALGNIGELSRILGDYGRALECFERTRAILTARGDASGAAIASFNIGVLKVNLTDFTGALPLFQETHRIWSAGGNHYGAARSLQGMGAAHHMMGDLEHALEYYGRSLSMLEKLGDLDGAASLETDLGLVYKSLGLSSEALHRLRRGYDLAQRAGNRRYMAQALSNLAELYDAAGSPKQAMDAYRKSLEIAVETGDQQGIIILQANIGAMHMENGDMEQAMELFRKSAAMAEENGDIHGQFMSFCSLSDAMIRSGNPGKGLNYAEEALALARNSGSWELASQARLAAGSACGALGRFAEAAAHYRAAIDAAEDMRALLSEDGHKSGFLGTKLDAYEGLVEVLLASSPPSPLSRTGEGVGPGVGGEESEAFSVAEKMRARSFLDEIGAARFAREGVPPELMEKKRLLEARMKWLAERE